MKLVLAASIAMLSVGTAQPLRSNKVVPPSSAEKPIQLAAMCTKVSERISQMNKICTYRCLSGEVAITISSTQLCPLTIDR